MSSNAKAQLISYLASACDEAGNKTFFGGADAQALASEFLSLTCEQRRAVAQLAALSNAFIYTNEELGWVEDLFEIDEIILAIGTAVSMNEADIIDILGRST